MGALKEDRDLRAMVEIGVRFDVQLSKAETLKQTTPGIAMTPLRWLSAARWNANGHTEVLSSDTGIAT